jgi:hypothetical protein
LPHHADLGGAPQSIDQTRPAEWLGIVKDHGNVGTRLAEDPEHLEKSPGNTTR